MVLATQLEQDDRRGHRTRHARRESRGADHGELPRLELGKCKVVQADPLAVDPTNRAADDKDGGEEADGQREGDAHDRGDELERHVVQQLVVKAQLLDLEEVVREGVVVACGVGADWWGWWRLVIML